MRFYTVFSARPEYYDRNPLDIFQNFIGGSVAPHALTTRWTYTVPSARKAFIGGGELFILRDATSGAPAQVIVKLLFTPSGGAGAVEYQIEAINGAIDSNRLLGLSAGQALLAGDAVAAQTFDGSTGGTNTLLATVTAVEFDA